MAEKKSSELKKQATAFVSGGACGAATVFIGHPLDVRPRPATPRRRRLTPPQTIKVRIQNDKPAPHNEFNGMADCFRKMVAKDGFRKGLYRGMSAPLVAVTPIFAVYFWGFDIGKKIWTSQFGAKPDGSLSTNGIVFAGGFSAIPGTLVMVPGDLIKVKLQSEPGTGKPPRFTNPINCAGWILRNEGPQGLFRGTALTLLRDVPGSMAYYTVYEVVKKELVNLSRDPNSTAPPALSPLAIMTAGGFSGIANWLVAVPPGACGAIGGRVCRGLTPSQSASPPRPLPRRASLAQLTPPSVLKSRYQTAPAGTYPGGIRQVASELLAKEGPGAFFKGLAPALTRAFPANAGGFLAMEGARTAMDLVWP